MSFLAGNVNEMVVGGKLIQGGEELLGFDEEIVVVVLLNLEEHVIDTEPVVAHGAAEIGEIALLTRETFEDIEELAGVRILRVIETDGVGFSAELILESLLSEIGNSAVHFQLDAVEIMKFPSKGKDFLGGGGIELHGLGTGIVTELADVVRAATGFVYLDFDELGIAGFEDFAKGDGGTRWCGRQAACYGCHQQE